MAAKYEKTLDDIETAMAHAAISRLALKPRLKEIGYRNTEYERVDAAVASLENAVAHLQRAMELVKAASYR